MRRLFWAVHLSWVLIGCATPAVPPQAIVSALPLPLQWAGEVPVSAEQQGNWWHSFDDPLLTSLVDEALARNLDLAGARLALARARALVEVAAAASALHAGSGGSAGRSRSGGQASGSLRAGLDASWEADLFGADRAATASATADAEAAAASVRALRLAVAAEAAIGVLQWQGLRAQAAAAEASLASQRQTLQLMQWRQQAGLVGQLELSQAQSGVDATGARLATLHHSRQQTEHALAVLLGKPPATLGQQLAATPVRTMLAPALPVLPQPAALLQRRPDLQAAQHRVESQLSTLAQREAERRPRITLGGNLAWQAATLSALGGAGALLAGITAAVDWTWLDGGAGTARVAAQQAAVESARVAWQAAVLAALQDVEDGLSAVARLGDRVQALARANASADESLRLARFGFEAGLNDFLALLDSERSALTAADALVSARVELASAHVRLYKAIGGGWHAGPADHSSASAPP